MKRKDAPPADDFGPLGRTVACPEEYSPSLLTPIPRQRGRALLGLEANETLPFRGCDVWTLYEASWLTSTGKPRRLVVDMTIPAETLNLVESKSLKLYMNSLNFKRFASDEEAFCTIRADVGHTLGCDADAVQLRARELSAPSDEPQPLLQRGSGGRDLTTPLRGTPLWLLLDEEDVDIPEAAFGEPDGSLLRCGGAADAPCEEQLVEERLVTHLLRTLCPCTSQPDWGSLLVEYEGRPIERGALLRYVCSMRREVGFHENAVRRVDASHHLASTTPKLSRFDRACKDFA